MAAVSRTLVVLAFLCSVLSGVWCYPTGAPNDACVSMMPGHGAQISGQNMETNPYRIDVSAVDYTQEETITVTISGFPFKGILLQARMENGDTPVGVFSNLPNRFKMLTCSSANDSVTHSTTSGDLKNSMLSVEWTAPDIAVGNIEFLATVVYTKEIFWVQVNSSVIPALPNVCASNPCLNGGACFTSSDKRSYFCGCTDQMNMGPNCEGDNSCNPNPCLNGGVCFRSSVTSSYFCQCSGPFDGNHCQNEIAPCSPNPCQNGAFCQESAGSFTCYCPADRYGELCENLIVPCSTDVCFNGATCLDTSTGYQCTCAYGWSGDDCRINLSCMLDSCMNGGTCFDSNPPGRLMFHCQCDIYYRGSLCETADPCRANPCSNGGTCTQVNSTADYSCSCIDGFEGDRCETTSNPCLVNPCENGGTCFRNQLGNVFCQCSTNFTGEYCRSPIHPCRLPTPLCLNGGTCYEGDGDNYYCACAAGYTGQHCENLFDPCAPSPCMNGGNCEAGTEDDTFTCSCPPGYFGDTCQNRGACLGVTCNNRGTCVAHEDQTGYTCQCAQSYDGDDCEYMNMCDVNNQCPNGSTCSYVGQGQVVCICPDGFTGSLCEVDISCIGTPCQNGGTCIPQGDGSYMCDCGAVYSGVMCEIYTNPCMSDPCVNGDCRIVLSAPTGRECICDADYVGVNCETYEGNACDVFECLNGGYCIDSDPGPTCVCDMDYSGLQCETPINLPPTFTGCPSGVNPSFPLLDGQNMARIELTITARDQQNRPLTLKVTDDLNFPSTITFTEEYREGKEITVEAEDAGGRRSVCSFVLRIFDNESPTVTCPSDLSEVTTDDSVSVSFPQATATDNLGVSGSLQYSPVNGSKFAVGSSTVIVKAYDTFDNQGECQFMVTVHKKESDCAAFAAPDNGRSSCVVVGDQRTCAIACNEGFGNAIGSDEYMCNYGVTSYWNPRPNTDICVPLKPGNGVGKTVSIRFSVDAESCSKVNSVTSSLTNSLQALGVCDPNGSPTSCDFSISCGNEAGGRRRRATTDLNVDVLITSPVSDGDTVMDVQMILDDAVNEVTVAAMSGSLSIEVDGATITNEPTPLTVSENTWNCKPGQISTSSGCLSCPPGTSHDAKSNTCQYCMVNTYQNKPEQDSCTRCPTSTETQQAGAYSIEHCGPMTRPQDAGPWTPALIGIIAGAGGLIILLLIVLACVYVRKVSRRPSERPTSSKDGPLSNFTHLNHAYEQSDEPEMQFNEPEMQFNGGQSLTSNTTYQNIDDGLDTASTDHLVRIPSLSQYSDYYATLNARSAPIIFKDSPPDSPPPPPPVSAPTPPQANGGPPPPPPAPPAPPSTLNMNNSNTTTNQNGSVMTRGSRAKFQV